MQQVMSYVIITIGTCVQSIGLKLDATATVGRAVCRRFCALLEDGVVKLLFVEHVRHRPCLSPHLYHAPVLCLLM